MLQPTTRNKYLWPQSDYSWSYLIPSHLLASPLSSSSTTKTLPPSPPRACHQSRVVPLFLYNIEASQKTLSGFRGPSAEKKGFQISPFIHVLWDLEIQWFWKKCSSDDSFFEITISSMITNVISQVENKCFAFSRGGRHHIYTVGLLVKVSFWTKNILKDPKSTSWHLVMFYISRHV